MTDKFDEDNPGYFQADSATICASPHCSNRLSGIEISDGLSHCSDECASEHRMGSDIVLFDNPFDLESEADEDEETDSEL